MVGVQDARRVALVLVVGLLAAHRVSGQIYWLENKIDNEHLTSGLTALAVRSCHFNQAGDLVVLSYEASIAPSEGDGVYGDFVKFSDIDEGSRSFDCIDVDDDGDDDLFYVVDGLVKFKRNNDGDFDEEAAAPYELDILDTGSDPSNLEAGSVGGAPRFILSSTPADIVANDALVRRNSRIRRYPGDTVLVDPISSDDCLAFGKTRSNQDGATVMNHVSSEKLGIMDTRVGSLQVNVTLYDMQNPGLCTFADVNQDGLDDIVLRDGDGYVLYAINDGTGAFPGLKGFEGSGLLPADNTAQSGQILYDWTRDKHNSLHPLDDGNFVALSSGYRSMSILRQVSYQEYLLSTATPLIITVGIIGLCCAFCAVQCAFQRCGLRDQGSPCYDCVNEKHCCAQMCCIPPAPLRTGCCGRRV